MKKSYTQLVLMLFGVLVFTGCSFMLGKEASPEKRTYTRVIEVPNRTKNSLYVGANSWFVSTFDDSRSVIEFRDKGGGKIIGKYVFSTFQGIDNFDVKQTISVDVKDNKVRFMIKDPYYKWVGYNNGNDKDAEDSVFEPLVTEEGLDMVRREWENLANSLADYLKKDTNW